MNLPYEFEQRMRRMLESEYEDFYHCFTSSPVHGGIRINQNKQGAEKILCHIVKDLKKVPWCEDGFYCDKSEISGNHPYHRAGLFYFQEPSAMTAAEGIFIEPGDKVLDLCAAPGGKSTQAAAKLRGRGLLVSNEIVTKRALILSENIERMGFPNVIVTNESPLKLEKKYKSYFNKIIVDAPCSGEGMFRKESRAIEEWSIEHTMSCAARQKNILDSAVKMLAPGGYLVYSTCTFASAENEGVAAYLLKTYPFLELADMPNLSMLCNGKGTYIGSNEDFHQTKRIFPHKQEGEGHFIALFYHAGEAAATEKQQKKEKTKAGKQKDISEMVQMYEAFERKFLTSSLLQNGEPAAFGDRLYLKPSGINVDSIRVIRCGLELGICKKGRFEPSHSLCMALKAEQFKNVIDFSAEDERLVQFLKGNVLPCEKQGWTVVTVDGFPIGWGKASGGILKNHYPKGLRLP